MEINGFRAVRRNLPERIWGIIILKRLNIFPSDLVRYIAEFLQEWVCVKCGARLPISIYNPESYRHRYCIIMKRAQDTCDDLNDVVVWQFEINRIANEESSMYLDELTKDIKKPPANMSRRCLNYF